MYRNLALEFVRITEAAAVASSKWMGKGDPVAADRAAVDAMREAFSKLDIDGTVVIGEGERDKAPMLYIGENVGKSEKNCPKIDIALDPLEGTSICANGGYGALSVIAAGGEGSFLHAPDVYMDKIAVGPKAKGAIDITKSPTHNINKVAKALGKSPKELTTIILDRDRHLDLISEVRSVGARIHMIGDGDVSAAISTSYPNSGIDMLLGIGGAPEGVLAAAALKCLNGDMQGKLKFKDEEKDRARSMGITNFDKVYTIDELAGNDVIFAATGVTDGSLLDGVKFLPNKKAKTFSIVMRSKTGTIRYIDTTHALYKKNL